MFIILLKYKKDLAIVDDYLASHRDYLETGYQKGYLVVSGPFNPREGGVLVSQLKDRQQVDDFIAHDPFKIYDIAEYQILEFTPVKFHKDFAVFI
jgi:uncharacterized protein YciI